MLHFKNFKTRFTTHWSRIQLLWTNVVENKLIKPSISINVLSCNAIFSLALYMFISPSVLNDPIFLSTIPDAYSKYTISGWFYLIYFLFQCGLIFFLGFSLFFIENLRNKLKCVFASNSMLSILNGIMLVILSLHIILCDGLVVMVNCGSEIHCSTQKYLYQLKSAFILFWIVVVIGLHLSIGMVQAYWPEKWKTVRKKSVSVNSRASVSYPRAHTGHD